MPEKDWIVLRGYFEFLEAQWNKLRRCGKTISDAAIEPQLAMDIVIDADDPVEE